MEDAAAWKPDALHRVSAKPGHGTAFIVKDELMAHLAIKTARK